MTRQNSALCLFTSGKPVCECNSGFVGDGKLCSTDLLDAISRIPSLNLFHSWLLAGVSLSSLFYIYYYLYCSGHGLLDIYLFKENINSVYCIQHTFCGRFFNLMLQKASDSTNSERTCKLLNLIMAKNIINSQQKLGLIVTPCRRYETSLAIDIHLPLRSVATDMKYLKIINTRCLHLATSFLQVFCAMSLKHIPNKDGWVLYNRPLPIAPHCIQSV